MNAGRVSQELVDAVMADLSAGSGLEERPAPVHGGLHEAAAVLAWFVPDALRPVPGRPGDDLDALLEHCELTADATGQQRWSLTRDVRVDVLRQLRADGVVADAVRANSDRPGEQMQRVLEGYLTGDAPPVRSQPMSTLTCSVIICGWLRAAGFTDLPPAAELDARLRWLTLLQPFEHLAGPSFRGRSRELSRLRGYAGIAVPGPVPSVRSLRPMLIHGPGGVGKSTLLARFILEHTEVHERDRFPFAYLDFDRPDIDAAEPLTLVMEAIRQLGVQYPEARDRCERIRRDWQEHLVSGRRTADRVRSGAVRDLAGVVGTLGAAKRPFLLVLDTFEEVQWRSEELVDAVWRLLEQFDQAVPRLRVLISGRAEVYGHPFHSLHLTGLDHAGAVEFLRAHGVRDRGVARSLARQVGGSPLSLKLAAQVYASEGADGVDLGTASWRLRFRVNDGMIQRQLYQRILRHIHDPDVRKLAHPGLVLRRITPALIAEVLAGPCRIEDADPVRLFDELRREVSLVTVAGDGSLHHRQDLRRLMIGLLRDEQPAVTREIHELAVAYYAAGEPTAVHRAEEIYHRLCLDQPRNVVDGRWMRGVEPFLQPALTEFTGARRAYLTFRLGLEADAETRRQASLEDWERLMAEKVAMVVDGPVRSDVRAALQSLMARTDRSPDSPLPPLEAAALQRLGDWRRAREVLEAAVDRAVEANLWPSVLQLTLVQARLTLLERSHDGLPALLDRLATFAVGKTSSLDALAAATRHAALRCRLPGVAATDQDDDVDAALRARCDEIADATFEADPQLAYWVCASARPNDGRRLARLLRLVGLPNSNVQALRQLAVGMAAVDSGTGRFLWTVGTSILKQQRTHGTWTSMILEASERSLGEMVADRLDRTPPGTLSLVLEAVSDLVGTALKIVAAPAERQTEPTTQRAAEPLRRLVATGLVESWSSFQLEQLLRFELDRNLYSIVGEAPFQEQVFRVVEAAAAEGWLTDLVLAARRARPANRALDSAAERLGISTITEGVSPPAARESLTRLARQICRIERRGEFIATGLLIGVDLVLTVAHAVLPLQADPEGVIDVVARFDLAAGRDGRVVDEGTTFPLTNVWLVWVSDSTDRGIAVLRLRGAPGVQPIGGPESGGDERGWFDLTFPRPVSRAAQLSILQYAGNSLRLLDTRGVVDVAPGQSGSPVVDEAFNVVGLVTGDGTNIPAVAVADELRRLDLN
ncbi:effector-associated domain EAD1-containing protein [Dactylosporangium sp. NPDC049742]|uniref:effector-associated domain EAD1-containing protein n=1 Tax=Dactylosporangium sp. NPDC049742 TaxID=3154737 RepID=UPI0034255C4D